MFKNYFVLLFQVALSICCSDSPSEPAVPAIRSLSYADSSLPLAETTAVAGAPDTQERTISAVNQKPVQTRSTSGADTMFYTSALGLVPNGQDQTNDIIRVLSDLPVGATLMFDNGPGFNVGSPITIRKPVRLITKKTAINYIGPAGALIFNIKSSDVLIRGFLVTAPYGSYVPNSFMIATSGSTNTTPYRNIEISDCSLTGYRGVGINLRYVRDFTVRNNSISNMPYAGVAGYSVINGVIDGNTIRDITADSTNSKNAYGITIQHKSDDSVSNTIRISNNRISGIPWEGIDTHGGDYLYIYNNDVKDCRVGIAMVSNRVKSPTGICIFNNRVEARGSNKSSIQFDGRSTMQSATGLIANNTIIGQHIRLENTSNMLVYGNEIRESGTGFGIYLNGYNYNSSILDNTIQDVWAKSGRSFAIYFDKDSNTAIVDGNKLVSKGFNPPRGAKNGAGFKISDKSMTSSAEIGNNDFGDRNDRKLSGPERKELLSKKRGSGNGRKSANADDQVSDGGVIVVDDQSSSEKLQLPSLGTETDGHVYLVKNQTGRSIRASTNLTRLADPSSTTNTLAANKTAILFYDNKTRRIWIL